MGNSRKSFVVVLVTIAVILALLVLLGYVVSIMGGRLYFDEPEGSSVSTFLGEIDLSSCSEGTVLKKAGDKWVCTSDNDLVIVAGGWEKDYDKSCSACATCGVFWGEGSCTATAGTSASFECSKGKRVKIAEYGEREQKTYWYQCIG